MEGLLTSGGRRFGKKLLSGVREGKRARLIRRSNLVMDGRALCQEDRNGQRGLSFEGKAVLFCQQRRSSWGRWPSGGGPSARSSEGEGGRWGKVTEIKPTRSFHARRGGEGAEKEGGEYFIQKGNFLGRDC